MVSIHSRCAEKRIGRLFVLLLAIGALAILSGCANNSASGSVYTYEQAQQEQVVRTGTVVAIRSVTIQNSQSSGFGGLAGGALGGIAGSAIGHGTGRALASVGGAVAGALAGNAVENQVGKTKGLEITIKLDNGETRVVTQAADIQITPGQRVRLIRGNGTTRVAPM